MKVFCGEDTRQWAAREDGVVIEALHTFVALAYRGEAEPGADAGERPVDFGSDLGCEIGTIGTAALIEALGPPDDSEAPRHVLSAYGHAWDRGWLALALGQATRAFVMPPLLSVRLYAQRINFQKPGVGLGLVAPEWRLWIMERLGPHEDSIALDLTPVPGLTLLALRSGGGLPDIPDPEIEDPIEPRRRRPGRKALRRAIEEALGWLGAKDVERATEALKEGLWPPL